MGLKVDLKATGFNDIINAWENFGDQVDGNIKQGVSSQLVQMENQMSNNVMSMFNKGFMTGMLASSVSHTVSIGKTGGVFGSVGVYNMSNKTGGNGTRATAPMLAYYYEHGIRPHSLLSGVTLEQLPTLKNPRGRKAKGVQGNPMHPGSNPIPFLSSVWDSQNEKITPAIIGNMEKEIKKL